MRKVGQCRSAAACAQLTRPLTLLAAAVACSDSLCRMLQTMHACNQSVAQHSVTRVHMQRGNLLQSAAGQHACSARSCVHACIWQKASLASPTAAPPALALTAHAAAASPATDRLASEHRGLESRAVAAVRVLAAS